MHAKTPEVSCNDARCPMHGGLKTRGAVRNGAVESLKARKTAVIKLSYIRKVPKYERTEKRRGKIHAHVPECLHLKVGDAVEFAECRKLSKTKAHVVTKVLAPSGLWAKKE